MSARDGGQRGGRGGGRGRGGGGGGGGRERGRGQGQDQGQGRSGGVEFGGESGRGGQFHARHPGGRGGLAAEHPRGTGSAPVAGEAASALQPVEDVLTRVSLAETGEGASSSSTAPAPVVAASGALPPTSSKSLVFPSRPGFGTAGRRCRVRANHFVVQLADKTIYHYDIAITPESISRERNRTIIKELIRLQQQYLDGRLPRGSKGEKEYRVTITEVAKLDMYSLKQFMAGRQRELPQDTIQALDIALRECPNGRYTSISRSFFAQSFGHGEIGSGVECWRGYYQSLRPTQMGLSLNIDISATAFYKAQPVMDFALEYLNIRDASRRLHDQDRLKLRKALKGIRVVATHRRDMSIHYKITGLTSDPLKELMFDQNGTTVSVVQYFKHQYNYSLKYVNWPCLQAGSDSRPTYLPMEVCIILEGQRYSRKLNEHQVRGILRLACERPSQREKSILEITSRNNYVNDYHAKEFGIKVTNQLAWLMLVYSLLQGLNIMTLDEREYVILLLASGTCLTRECSMEDPSGTGHA
ncbi:hypothetical protein GUJ93_ZPchr0013g37762 [Zizania palustris]|uniref:PAZ domain-containing protein n=1 Tax=Zizania palustris TaxID=103762 RepID=A0A8J5WZ17_ZIZPA|nr:hypothetical protein GUJ93_ZPchr0013g37762 [Zizania palustris]